MRKWIHGRVSLLLVSAVALLPGAAPAAEITDSGAPTLEERVKQLEAAAGQKEKDGKWFDRVQVSGLVEVEAGYGEVDREAGDDVRHLQGGRWTSVRPRILIFAYM